MKKLTIIIPLIFGAFIYNSSIAQEPDGVRAPPEQRELSNILSKYNDLYQGAPNNMQQRKIELQYRKEFCAAIPKGDVSGWIGTVLSIDDYSEDKGIRISIEVAVESLGRGFAWG